MYRRHDTYTYMKARVAKKGGTVAIALSRAREATDDGTILRFARYLPSGASIERPNNESRTCGFQRAMTQTQFKTEFELKNRRCSIFSV